MGLFKGFGGISRTGLFAEPAEEQSREDSSYEAWAAAEAPKPEPKEDTTALIRRAESLQRDVDLLGTSGGYVTEVMSAELRDAEAEMADRAERLESSVESLGTSGGYATLVMEEELREIEAALNVQETPPAPEPEAAAPERMSAETAVGVVQDNLDVVAAAAGSEPRGATNWPDLEGAAASGELGPELQEAVDTLLANDELVLQIARTGAPFNSLADDFDSDSIDRFLVENEHMRNLVPALPALDVNGQRPEDADGFLSAEDIVFSDQIDFSSYPREVQDAVQYVRTEPDFRALFTEGLLFVGMSEVDFLRTAGQRQIFDDHAEEAYSYALTLPHPADDNFQGVPITTIDSVQFQALADAAIRGAPDSDAVLGVTAHFPETVDGDRNAIFTSFYDAMGNEIREGINHDGIESGANFASLAAWASFNVGPGIRGEQGAFGVGLPMGDRQALADGNQLIFSEMVGPLAGFAELVQDDGLEDASAVDEYLNGTFNGEPRFGPEQDLVRAGVLRWMQAANADSAEAVQSAMFEGNFIVLIHDQSSLQPYFDDVLDQGFPLDPLAIPMDVIRGLGGDSFGWDPRDADSRVATDQLDPVFGGITIPADSTVPSLAGPDNAIAALDVGDFDTVAAITADSWSVGDIRIVTSDVLNQEGAIVIPVLEIPDFVTPGMMDLSVIAEDGGNSGTEVDDFRDYPDRMFYLSAAFRETQTLPGIWQTEGTGIPIDETWLGATGLAPDFANLAAPLVRNGTSASDADAGEPFGGPGLDDDHSSLEELWRQQDEGGLGSPLDDGDGTSAAPALTADATQPSYGEHLLQSQIDQLVAAMSAFDPTAGDSSSTYEDPTLEQVQTAMAENLQS